MNQGIRKRLRLEGLEERQCFSVDIGAILANLDVPANVIELVRHNYDQPTDVNVDGRTTPSDALNVINELNSKSAAVNTVASINSAMMADTNGDKRVTPADALVVINYLNDRIADVEIATEKTSSIIETEQQSEQQSEQQLQQDLEQLILKTFAQSQDSQESVATLLGRLRDQGIIDIGSLDLSSLNLDWPNSALLENGTHDIIDTILAEVEFTNQAVIGSSLQGSGAASLSIMSNMKVDSGLLLVSSTIDAALLIRDDEFSKKLEQTYDPTDDNGNGFFRSDDDAQPIKDSIEAELRKQLKLDDSALIQVAIFVGGDEVQSGTWKYLTDEGATIWGNWRQTPNELRLFLSNVEEENRIYGQYPGGSFLYFSWLENAPVGFYFTPIGIYGTENPVPTERYTEYYSQIPGADTFDFGDGSLIAFAGDLEVFDGVQPIESLLSDLFAIQNKWNDELLAANS